MNVSYCLPIIFAQLGVFTLKLFRTREWFHSQKARFSYINSQPRQYSTNILTKSPIANFSLRLSSRPVVLNHWVSTLWVGGGCLILDIYIIFIAAVKLQLWSSKKIIVWLGVTRMWGTVLNGHNIRKVENHFPEQGFRFIMLCQKQSWEGLWPYFKAL